MQRTARKQVVRCIVLSGAFGAATATAWPGVFEGEPTTTRYAPQVGLYVSRSFGSGSTSRLRWGMRIEEIGGTPTPPPTDARVGTSQRRELVDLQLAPSSDATIVFGKRLTWNLARRTLGTQSSSAAPESVAVAAMDRFGLPDRWQLPRWGDRKSDPSRAEMTLGREPRVDWVETKNNVRPSIFVFDTRRGSLTAVEFPRWPGQRCCTSGRRPDVGGNMALAARGDRLLRAPKDIEVGNRTKIESLAQARFHPVPGLSIGSLK